MSDVMLFGVLQMPYEMAMQDDLARHQYWQRGQQAADTITRLTAEVERLRAALMPFAEALKGNWSKQPDDMPLDVGFGPMDLRIRIPIGDFRRARAAITQETSNESL